MSLIRSDTVQEKPIIFGGKKGFALCALARPSYRCIAALALYFLVLGELGALAQDAEGVSPTVLITGSNRGIGLEFARQYAEKGWRVIATCRRPEEAEELKKIASGHPNLTIERLDVTDQDQIESVANKYADIAIDVLLNNAGVLGGPLKSQRFGRVDYDQFRLAMAVNAVGPLRMAEAFALHVATSEQKKIVNITSVMGSLDNAGKTGLGRRITGGLFIYPPSKTALNMMMRTLALELEGQGVIVSLIHPGGVNTDIVPVPGFLRRLVLMSAEKSVRHMIDLIDGLTPEQSGVFLQYDGDIILW